MNKLIEELAARSCWLPWKGEPKFKDGKPVIEPKTGKQKITKIPYSADKNKHYGAAKWHKPETRVPYEQAEKIAKFLQSHIKGPIGMGVVLDKEFGLVCIDVDDCRYPDTGKIEEWAQDIMDLVKEAGGTYTELSPSGTGFHIWGRGRLPNDRGIKRTMNNGHDIELYSNDHYITVTKNAMNDIPLNDIQPAIDTILSMLKNSPAANKSCSPSDAPPCECPKLSDEEVKEKIRKSRSGPKFHSLYDLGDVSAYQDGQCTGVSEADQALLSILAFWTKDAEQIKRIYRSSKLYENQNWNKHNEEDYLNRSITRALETVKGGFNPKAYAARKQAEELRAEFKDNVDMGPEEGPTFSLDSQKKPIKCVENLSILLKSKGISIRKNIVTKSVDVVGSKGLESLDYNAQAIKIRNMTKLSHLNLSKQDTNDFLDLIANENSYSPVCDYLMDCYNDYDGGDYISPLFNMLSLDTDIPQDVDFCKNLFIKWLLECAIIPFNRKTMRKLATQQGVLTLVGGQGVGKTRFPLNTILKDKPEYLITGETIDPKDKDSVLRAIGCWIFELSEFSESSTAKQQDALKSFIDRGKDKIRPPYAAKAIDEPRTCVFYATTNRTEFMHDPTGGRRWWPLAITKINIDENFNARQLWGQVMHLWKDEHEEPYPLTEEETKELAKHNNNFSAQSDAELAISEYLDFDTPQDRWEWVSPAGLSNELNRFFINRSYKPEATGKALTAMCRKNPAIEKRRGHKGIEYLLPLPADCTSDNHKEKNAPAPTQEEPDFTSDMSED